MSTNASLSSLLSRSTLDDHTSLLSASEAALKISGSDLQAQRVKLVALLKLDRFKDAVSFVEGADAALKEKAGLEYAYALYKAGEWERAAQVASGVEGSRGARHVEAQVRYFLEDYDRTAEVYRELKEEEEVVVQAEEYDMRVNQGAIDAQGLWLGRLDAAVARRPDREDLASFETAYNAACGSIARGELSQAEVLLKRAKTLCQHSEEFTEVQKAEELLPILVQQTYVLQRQGKITEAEALVNEMKTNDRTDAVTQAIAVNNQLAGSGASSNPFIVHKEYNKAPRIPKSEKLFSYQSIPLSSNEKTVDLNSLKFEGLARSTKNRPSKDSSASASTSTEDLLRSVFNAAATARNAVGNAAINKILPDLQQRPKDLGLVMLLTQMYTMIGNTTSAIELVEAAIQRLERSTAEEDQKTRYHPGLVSMVTALYRLQGRKDHVRQELAKAANYWTQKQNPPVSLLRAAGISLLASSNTDDAESASKIFDKLYQEQHDDRATIAGFVASHAFSQPGPVEKLADKLKPVSELVADIDVNALESAGISQASNALAIAQAGTSRKRTAPSAADEGKKKRIRKSRLPKDYDSSAPGKPDPERWLPMRDRSYYRPPKGKKKGKKGDDRTQGGAVSEELDVSKQPQKGGEVVGGGGGGAKKKKGRGKK